MPFRHFGFGDEILRALENAGYARPTPVQAAAIPKVMQGHDLISIAQTGTGKTAAFVLPMLHRLEQSKRERNIIRALILAPTRELAVQITDNIRAYGKQLLLRVASIYGGVDEDEQIKAVRKGVQIIVATPGRLIDLLGRQQVDLGSLEMLVLDEADRMLHMGFLPDIETIVESLPRQRQTLMFSATFPRDVETLALGPGDLIGDLFTLSAKIALNNDGGMVVAYIRPGSDGASNLIVRRGSIRTGSLGTEELLESRSAPAAINGFWSNAAGQLVLMWYQYNGTRLTQYASTLDSPGASWTTTELGAYSTTDVYAFGTLTSQGDLYVYTSTCNTLRRVNGAWISASALPTALCGSSNAWAMDNNGNLLAVNRLDGRWASFDARGQTFVQSFVNTTPTTGPGFVLGTRWNSLAGTLLLSGSGIGAYVSVNSFDALPTAAAPNGDSRGTTVKNLWNIYFK
jgi:hypothetical protein